MASKFGLAGGLPERRVRPIWDAVDSRQFKNALKLVTAVLAKSPNSPYALALKALILERMGKPEEALAVCLNAKEHLHTNDAVLMDDLTLSTLQTVFQRLDHLDLATSCYEYACGKFPNNMELMMGLFNCYVREYSFVKQQQTAIKMYKLSVEERTLLWAVCSVQLQVFCGNGGEKLLQLAEGLIKKHVASHSLHEVEALMVYISILEQQAKYGDALDILSGDLGSLIAIEVDKLRLQGRLLARAGDYSAAASIYQKTLELSPDDWESFQHYLGCLLEDDRYWGSQGTDNSINKLKYVDLKIPHLADEVFDSRISNAEAFVEKLREDTDKDSIRGPYLATLEIERKKHLQGKGDSEKLSEFLVQYIVSFGHLACSSSDVEVYFDMLSPEKRKEVLSKIRKSYDGLSAVVPTKLLGQSITVYKIQMLIAKDFALPIDDLKVWAVQMAKMFGNYLPLSKDLDPQENMHGEELLAMLCNLLVQLFWRTGHVGYFIEAIMVLEFGLNIGRHVWQCKILLLHLYSHWGALSLAHERYKLLDVKNIMMETVSHHILPQILVSPLWADLNNLLQDYLKFMDDHMRESADLTFLAYRHRNYSKVIEFVQFKEQLQHSNQYLVARVEAPILQLKKNADNLEEEEAILDSLKCGIHFIELSSEIGSKSLTFNEDMQTRPWWTPSSERNYLLGPFEGVSFCPRETLLNQREESVRRLVERRSLLPRMIYLSIQSATSLKENSEVNGSVSDPKISSELKTLLERYAKMLGFTLSDAIDRVLGIPGGQKSSEVFGSDLVDWLNFAIILNSWDLSARELDRVDGESHTWQIVNSLVEKTIAENMSSIELSITTPWINLPILVQLVSEPLAWHGLVLQACVRSSIPSGKRKKKSGPTDPSALSRTRESVQSSCDTLEKLINWLKEHLDRPVDEKLDSFLSTFHKKEQDGPGQVFEVLETLALSANETDHGDRISQSLKSWSSVDVARKVVIGKSAMLVEFLRICESKFKMLQGLKRRIAQV